MSLDKKNISNIQDVLYEKGLEKTSSTSTKFRGFSCKMFPYCIKLFPMCSVNNYKTENKCDTHLQVFFSSKQIYTSEYYYIQTILEHQVLGISGEIYHIKLLPPPRFEPPYLGSPVNRSTN